MYARQIASAPAQHSDCPRCQARLIKTYNEPECLQCGYQDYKFAGEARRKGDQSLLSSATRYVVRYIGDSPSLRNVTTYVQAVRTGNRLAHEVECPFCPDKAIMEQSSLSGKRREFREERFKCADSHRVSLTPDKSGFLAWK